MSGPVSDRYAELLEGEAVLFEDKNFDYASGGDELGNFKRVAEILNLYPDFPYQTAAGVAIIYMLKQLDALLWGLSMGIHHRVEGIGPRASDVSVYAKLIRIICELKRS
jgi:hypothetical protein